MVSNSSLQHKPTDDLSARHKQVLDTAMTLIAERGLRGASLRELARRLQMSQPSLYHYFDTKEALVAQIIANYSQAAMSAVPNPLEIGSLRELLRTALVFIADLYAGDAHVTWVRFLFAVTMERPEFGGLLRAVFIERAMDLANVVAAGAVERGEIRAEDVRPGLELAAGALTMRLLEKRVMAVAAPEDSAEDDAIFIDFVVDTVTRGVKCREQADKGGT